MVRLYKDRHIIVGNRKYYPLKDVLVFDIETSTIDKTKAISAENSNLKIWGAYSFNSGKLTYGKAGPAFQRLNQPDTGSLLTKFPRDLGRGADFLLKASGGGISIPSSLRVHCSGLNLLAP